MQLLWRVLLLSLSLFQGLSISHLNCDTDTQYAWPYLDPQRCCQKCKPGERMVGRCTTQMETQCKGCGQDHYSDTINIEQSCKPCLDCSMDYMVYRKNCTASSNSVCGCMPGYRCESEPCVNCVPKRTATASTKKNVSTPPSRSDSNKEVKLLLSMCLVCVCTSMLLICITFASRRQLAKWKSKGLTVFWFSKDNTEEDAQTPIQEEGGKPDKCETPDC